MRAVLLLRERAWISLSASDVVRQTRSPVMETITPNGRIGTAHWRVEGVAKVTGRALYGADQAPVLAPGDRAVYNAGDPVADLTRAKRPVLYAALRTSPIARGQITGILETHAREIPGVCQIFTYTNVGKRIKPGKPLLEHGYMSQAVAPLLSDNVLFPDQVIAVVIANTFEIATQAAESLEFSFHVEPPAFSFDSAGAKVVKAKALGETELKAGDAAEALAESAVCVDTWYETPAQHHNPLELFQTTCDWVLDGDGQEQLRVWESTQNTRGFQHGLAKQLGIKPAQIRILSPYIGGAFGSRGELGQFTAIAAFAARELGQPVKLVATRRQCFSLRTFRAETRHHIKLGADAQGKLLALDHESWELTSRTERFATAGSDSTSRLYACANVRTLVHNVETDRQAPGFMRAPPEMPYLFAMESAMDELAYKLNLDPVELRRRNDTLVELATDRPYTSRSLVRCIDRGAELFGWADRNPVPGSMSEGDDLIGWGFASAFYPTQIGPADCRITLNPSSSTNGSTPSALVEVGTHEIGTGIRTVVAMTVADLLGLPMEAVEVRLGDSDLPAAPLSAGSNSTATITSVLAKCCMEIRETVAAAAVKDKASPLHGLDAALVRLIAGRAVFTHDPQATAPTPGQVDALHPQESREQEAEAPLAFTPSEPLGVALRRVSRGKPLVRKTTNTPHGAPPVIGPMLVRKGIALMVGGAGMKDRIQFAQGAHFVEVRISRSTGTICVSRMVGVFAGGRIINPRTAYAQLQGGQVWGLSSALEEATELDPMVGRYVNADLGEYHLPVCRDIPDITTVMLEEEDNLVNQLGVKGIGELGVTGMAAAIANAVFHATGERFRSLPIRLNGTLKAMQARTAASPITEG